MQDAAIAERSVEMMKLWNRVLPAVLGTLCLFVLSGCNELLSMYDQSSPTRAAESTPTATVTAMATSTLSPRTAKRI